MLEIIEGFAWRDGHEVKIIEVDGTTVHSVWREDEGTGFADTVEDEVFRAQLIALIGI